MVVAAMDVTSLIRRAARPVGAHNTTFSPESASLPYHVITCHVPCAAKHCAIERMTVVLPTPGPPVTTLTLDPSTWQTARVPINACIH